MMATDIFTNQMVAMVATAVVVATISNRSYFHQIVALVTIWWVNVGYGTYFGQIVDMMARWFG